MPKRKGTPEWMTAEIVTHHKHRYLAWKLSPYCHCLWLSGEVTFIGNAL